MGGNGFEVDTGEMRSHASHLQGVSEQIGKAQDAAGEVSMNGTDAYGILCSPILTPLIGTVEVGGMSAIAASNGAVSATSEAINMMADGYDEMEEQLGKMFEEIAGQLGGK